MILDCATIDAKKSTLTMEGALLDTEVSVVSVSVGILGEGALNFRATARVAFNVWAVASVALAGNEAAR